MNFNISLRSISTFVMIAAIAVSLFYRSSAASAETENQKLQDRQNDLVIKIVIAEAVTSKNLLPEQSSQKAEEISSLFDMMGGSGDVSVIITKSIILDYLGRTDLIQKIAGIPETDPHFQTAAEYRRLYENSEVLPDNAVLFSTPAGALAEIRNLQIQGRMAESEEKNSALLTQGLHITSMLFMIAAGSLILFTGSIITFIWFMRSKPRPYFPEALSGITVTERNAMFETVIIFLFFMFPAGMLLQSVLYGRLQLQETLDPVFFQMIWIPFIFLISVFQFQASHKGAPEQYRKILYTGKKSAAFREILWGIVGFTGIFPIALIFTMITVQLSGENPGSAEHAHPLVFHLEKAPLLIFFFAAGIVPVIEEVIFRGFLFGYLRLKSGLYFSAFLSGSIFALLHPQGWIALPYLTVLGMGLAVLREYRPGIIAPVVTHSIVNGMAVIFSWLFLFS